MWELCRARRKSDFMMGVETPMPPFVISAAAPKGAPRRFQIMFFFRKPYLPRRAPRGALRRGALVRNLKRSIGKERFAKERFYSRFLFAWYRDNVACFWSMYFASSLLKYGLAARSVV